MRPVMINILLLENIQIRPRVSPSSAFALFCRAYQQLYSYYLLSLSKFDKFSLLEDLGKELSSRCLGLKFR